MKNKTNILFYLTWLLVGNLFCQKTDPGLNYTFYHIKVDFPIVNGSVTAQYHNSREIVYTSKEGYKKQNFHNVYYSGSFTKDRSFKASVAYKKENGGFKNKKIKRFTSDNISSKGIFYDDLIETYCVYPNLSVGSKTYFEFNTTYTDVRLLPCLLFNNDYSIEKLDYEITIPDFLKVNFVFIGDSSGITHTIVRKKNATVHKYSGENRKRAVFENRSTSLFYYVPHLYVVPVSFINNGTTSNLVGTVSNLLEHYNAHISQIKPADSTQLYYVTDSLVAKVTDTLTKIQKIFNWVQQNIKYVAFEEGMNAFVPRNEHLVFAKKYGDCKDKAHLLVQMLNHVKINAYHSWIGSRNKPYSYSQLCSPFADDHMICSVKLNNCWYFLDATAPFVELGLPSGFIQGKETFIRLSEKECTIQKVPIIDSKVSVISDSINVSLENSVIKGDAGRKLTGYINEDYITEFTSSKSKESGEKMLKENISIGNNKLTITDFNYNTGDKEMTINYQFNLPDYAKDFENKIYVNLNLIKDFENAEIKEEERELSIYKDYKYKVKQVVTFHYPKDKKIQKLPKNYTFSDEDFSFNLNYSLSEKAHAITLRKEITLNHLELKKEKFKQWNAMINELNNAYSEVAIFE